MGNGMGRGGTWAKSYKDPETPSACTAVVSTQGSAVRLGLHVPGEALLWVAQAPHAR